MGAKLVCFALVVNLDNFAETLDELGWQTTDEILCKVARWLAPKFACVTRSKDEFLALVVGKAETEITEQLEEFLDSYSEWFASLATPELLRRLQDRRALLRHKAVPRHGERGGLPTASAGLSKVADASSEAWDLALQTARETVERIKLAGGAQVLVGESR